MSGSQKYMAVPYDHPSVAQKIPDPICVRVKTLQAHQKQLAALTVQKRKNKDHAIVSYCDSRQARSAPERDEIRTLAQ